jgi:hypothetical protein
MYETDAELPEPILQFFEYSHLPPELGKVSEMFFQLAWDIVNRCPRNPQRTTALNQLLLAKDAAVRSVVYKGPAPTYSPQRAA